MTDIIRLACAALLLLSLLNLWQNWEEWNRRINQAATETVRQLPGDSASAVPDAGAPAPAAASPQAAEPDVPAPTQRLAAPGQDPDSVPDSGPARPGDARVVRVETDWLSADISENGANLVALHLKKHKLESGGPFPLLQSGNGRFYTAQSGAGGGKFPNHNSGFALVDDGGGRGFVFELGESDSVTVAFRAASEGAELHKRFVFRKSDYLVGVEMEMRNLSGRAQNPYAYFQLARDTLEPRNYSSLLPTFFGAAMFTEESKFLKIPLEDAGAADYPRKSGDGWIGIIQRYFAAAWLPRQGDEREYFIRRAGDGGVRVGVIVPFGEIPPGESRAASARLFAGAEEQNILNRLHESGEAPGIHLAVDYGWLTIVAVFLFWLMDHINAVVGNWGVSIILLTFAVKLVFYPLTNVSYRSMAKLKDAAPHIKRMQEKYGGDREQLQRETMKFYREKKINPFGGCLPMLVQIPVFIALYWVLLGSVELRHAPFVGWLSDLSAPDPFFTLSLMFGGAMFMQTRLSPAPADPTHAMIMKFMPLGFAAFSVFFPSGLVLYWLVNTLLSIAQQWNITRALEKAKTARQGGNLA